MTGGQPAIELSGLGLRRGERWILRDIDWTVPAGTCAAILGPNGSGKSTLARVLACHLWPTTGEATVLGGRFGEANLIELRESIRLVQAAGPYDMEAAMTARQVVLTGFFGTIGLYDPTTPEMLNEADRVLDLVGLHEVADHPYGTLSSGERVRGLIARALVRRPRLLLLDEPTAGLDLLAREKVLDTIQAMFDADAEAPTVILITHHVEELPPATSEILLLDDGRVGARGAPEAVLRGEVLSKVYRCPLDVHQEDGRYYVRVNPGKWDELLRRRG